jgi:glycosyltransferase involved in cell wall biosynthesis
MQSNIITVIPVYNGERFLLRTLHSVAAQTVKPDRLILLDNCSSDGTAKIVQDFQGLKCEYIRNPTNLGLFGNMNRALEFAEQTRYLHILCADDLITPRFFETLVPTLEACSGFGTAFCLDERIDENDVHLSVSGKITGAVEKSRRQFTWRRRARSRIKPWAARSTKPISKEPRVSSAWTCRSSPTWFSTRSSANIARRS